MKASEPHENNFKNTHFRVTQEYNKILIKIKPWLFNEVKKKHSNILDKYFINSLLSY